MVRHNNMVPFQHFHKKWQRMVRTKFHQPARKRSRNLTRIKKARLLAPRPIQRLRPIVNCPSFRYNSRIRIGRGFTLLELKGAGINKDYAKSIGIAVEYRRKTKSVETLQRNVQRLKEYMGRLVVYPTNNKKAKEILPFQSVRVINNIKQPETRVKSRVPTEEEKKFEAYVTLRKARSESKSRSRKLKKSKNADNIDLDSEFKK